jgi:hypothetical protein
MNTAQIMQKIKLNLTSAKLKELAEMTIWIIVVIALIRVMSGLIK